MIERRKKPRKDWVVGNDEVGQSVLKWEVDPRATARQEADPNARTYDFLRRLEVPGLAIEDEEEAPKKQVGRNPYDSAPGSVARKQRGLRK